MIESERLVFMLLDESHLDDIAKLHADPEVRKFFPGGAQNRAETLERMRELISFYETKKLPCFVLFNKDTNEFIGRCGFGPYEQVCEVGYLIRRDHWREGYASEALTAVLKWAKDNIESDKIIGFAPAEHIASQKVMEKCGMEFYKEDDGHGVFCRFYQISNR